MADFRFCPHCGKELPGHGDPASRSHLEPANRPLSSYDQTAYWKAFLKKANDRPSEISVAEFASKMRPPGGRTGPARCHVHLLLNRMVQPSGSLMSLILSDGRLRHDKDRLEASGYTVGDDGKIIMVDDLPAGHLYLVLKYWAGERQFRRWHMAQPARISASRNGDPYFIDDNIACFGVEWADFERLQEASEELATLLLDSPILKGQPIMIKDASVFWA